MASRQRKKKSERTNGQKRAHGTHAIIWHGHGTMKKVYTQEPQRDEPVLESASNPPPFNLVSLPLTWSMAFSLWGQVLEAQTHILGDSRSKKSQPTHPSSRLANAFDLDYEF